MTISAATTWEVRTDGNDSNGGGFAAGASGTDRSQQAAAHALLTVTSTVHTTTTQVNVNAGDYTVIAADVGNILQITGGTATAGWYEITAADIGNNRWTLDRSAGTSGQTVSGNMGGALASPGQLGKLIANHGVNYHKYWVKSGTYTLTNNVVNTPGGPFSIGPSISISVRGYETTRGDTGAKPVIDAGAQSSLTIAFVGTNRWTAFENFKVDGKGNASVIGVASTSSSRDRVCLIEAVNCTEGIKLVPIIGQSSTTNCATGFSTCLYIDRCFVKGGTSGITGARKVTDTVVTGCSGVGITLDANTANYSCSRLTVHGCGSHGVQLGGGAIDDSVMTNNGGYGVYLPLTYVMERISRCFFRSNTSGPIGGTQHYDNSYTMLTADPYTDAALYDFSPNDTAGGGALLRGAAMPVLGQTDNRDAGAVQHADPAGGGGGRPNLLRRLQALSGASLNG